MPGSTYGDKKACLRSLAAMLGLALHDSHQRNCLLGNPPLDHGPILE
jgi:hypothetical protein